MEVCCFRIDLCIFGKNNHMFLFKKMAPYVVRVLYFRVNDKGETVYVGKHYTFWQS